jgi:hypothetical protein
VHSGHLKTTHVCACECSQVSTQSSPACSSLWCTYGGPSCCGLNWSGGSRSVFCYGKGDGGSSEKQHLGSQEWLIDLVQ